MARTRSNATIRDVAAAAGVSVSTVSRVLNNKSDVAAETAERIHRVISELGYASGLAAKSLRSRKTNVVGLLVPDMKQSYSLQIIRGVSRVVAELGYGLLAYSSGKKGRHTQADWEQQQVALLNGSITDGIIVVTPSARTFRTGEPLVAVDPHSEAVEFPAVIATNHVGALAAMNHLISLGHRRIGFIGGRPELQSSQRRLQGYYDSLSEAQIMVDPALVQVGDFTYDSGHRCAQALLALAAPPTAIFAANDEMAFGAMAAAEEAGVRIPADLSLVGFDNVPEAAATHPPLTTVDQSLEKMGQVAAELLIKVINGAELAHLLHKVPTTLIVRESCRRHL
jgi:LacI family transcriptional regulator